MKKIIFRMDDICPDMNYAKFSQIRDIFIAAGIKPLIGVIPCNKDEKLTAARAESVSKGDDEIWQELKSLQDDSGWEIALHGYEHLKKAETGGIMNFNPKSEFAGLPYEEQLSAIRKGKEILESKGLKCLAFMAPSHSFDILTLRALRTAGISTVTDGKGVYPYEMEGCTMMPVPYAAYRNLPFGIYTVCLHTNTMRDKDIEKLKAFIAGSKKYCISFSEGLSLYKGSKSRLMSCLNPFMESMMKIGLRFAVIISKIKHKMIR